MIPYTIHNTPITAIIDECEEQNPSVLGGFPGRIKDGFPDMTLESYMLSAPSCNIAAVTLTFTLCNCAAAAEVPVPEPLMGNGATCCSLGDDSLILY